MKVRFDCPQCGVTLQVPAHARGRVVRCGKCDERVDVPRGEEAVVIDDAVVVDDVSPEPAEPETAPTPTPPPLEPLVIRPSGTLATSVRLLDDDEPDDPDDVYRDPYRSFVLRRTVSLVACVTLVVVGFVYRAELQTGLSLANERLIEFAAPNRSAAAGVTDAPVENSAAESGVEQATAEKAAPLVDVTDAGVAQAN